ncbi:hypothetical protein ABW20_dc0101104 [Dactylellina cionopaga]|nr:hypothetical protein ABW20_dc0101104 [Dactylellina cionopaga]
MADDADHASPPRSVSDAAAVITVTDTPVAVDGAATASTASSQPIETMQIDTEKTSDDDITAEDSSRKRKSMDEPGLMQSPQKRPKTADSEMQDVNDDEASTTTLITAITTPPADMATIPSHGSDGTQPSAENKPSSVPLHLPLLQSTTSSSQQLEQFEDSMPPPPLLLSQQQQTTTPTPRENLQFTATDLPKDDDGMMRWLAHRVRDSAAQNRDNNAEHSDDHGGGGVDSDPESRAERERVRAENRERKKKWREENIDRNKDNDLRGRVSRRASKLFGPENSEKKRTWMEAEFNRRKVKREFKTQLKKNETPGSGCWNANDDFSDNPSNVMAGVLTNVEGAAENLRNWIENGEIDDETWNAACQRLWGDPGMREYLESLAPETTSGSGTAEAGKLADDGLASKFDAAFDAIIGRGVPKIPSGLVPPAIQATEEVPMESATTSEAVEDIQKEAEMEATIAMELDTAIPEEDQTTTTLGQLTEEDLHRLIESGEMSFEDIAALEAALRDDDPVEGHDAVEELDGDGVMLEDQVEEMEEQLGLLPQAEEVDSQLAAATQDVDMNLPDLHSDHTDISELHQHLEMMSPHTRDVFLATIMSDESGGVALNEMQLDSIIQEAADAAAMMATEAEEAAAITTPLNVVEETAQQEEALGIEDETAEAVAEATEAGEGEAGVLEFLENAGISLDELDEEQLQKFINAVSGDGDIDEVLAEIHLAQQSRQDTTQDVVDLQQQQQQQQQEHTQAAEIVPGTDVSQQDQVAFEQPAFNSDQDNMDLTAELNEDDEEMYGDGDYDDDDELDLTPDIMRIILQHSNYSSLLGGQTIEGLSAVPPQPSGDAHATKPMPSAPSVPLILPASRTHQLQQQASPAARQSYIATQRQQQYAYSPSKYSYNYSYGYQRRPEVQVLPPGYSAYQRPPVMPEQEAPRYPDLSYLIKPLAYKPKQVSENGGATTPIAVSTTATESPGAKGEDQGSNGINGVSDTNGVNGVNGVHGNDDKKKEKSKTAGWADIFKFQIPIPRFLGRGAGLRRPSEQEKVEEERNVRAMGFPPMVAGLQL